MIKGYLRTTNDAMAMKQCIEMLCEQGVQVEHIIISDDFSQVKKTLVAGDRIVVCRLSDICMSISDLFATITSIAASEVTLYSINEPWLDVNAPSKNIVELIGRLNELSNEIGSIRTKQGLKKARNSGKVLGRPFGTVKFSKEQLESALNMYTQSNMTVDKICEIVGIKQRMLYRYIKAKGVPLRKLMQ